ncbi:hypothetical protein XBKB1_1290001 [Xenorhabdus bovienii str. kraussei Becker Underwood]|uniref:Uncharacterized protein n=1 Tax=Xenorhabdus bovienii str. kraussei Becker Underwood TaxID=1398204 RepID=A0A077PNX8_XENBV|nr:hypothetical protein XBKB1_1290001 [Xenorhabdus bovienii str. kraussei Becker Underwood]
MVLAEEKIADAHFGRYYFIPSTNILFFSPFLSFPLISIHPLINIWLGFFGLNKTNIIKNLLSFVYLSLVVYSI